MSITPALPKGSIVLVTAANGYIATHVVDQLLQLGYRVRGTVRSPKPWLNKLFAKYGDGMFETVIVDSLQNQSAFDEATKGVDGVIHIAADMSFSTDAAKVIPPTVAGVVNVMTSAAKQPSIKRVVLCSSSTACTLPKSFEPTVEITSETWDEEAIAMAYDLPDGIPESFKGYIVLAASRTEAEKAAWKFMKEHNPGFVFNAVLPDTTLGKILDPENIPGSTGGWIRNIYVKHDFDTWRLFAPQYFIEVVDCARVHVAALLHPSANSQRLFAYQENFMQADILRILRELKPEFDWPKDPEPAQIRDRSTVPEKKISEKYVADLFGSGSWKSLEQSLRETFEDVEGFY
ncbi:hypothetical protein BP5796_07776 [Coleophoma crateriformis]|uniref:NAD-dependent epimerase/dehydratase domain-containing protein n=1 Tax=Coleophoma crateriformis TaxID=565419 RepID=A0A3D8RCH3_9HELO|nr:hypothetical protein BP5796_07776 [Coleophoma crateriformis]